MRPTTRSLAVALVGAVLSVDLQAADVAQTYAAQSGEASQVYPTASNGEGAQPQPPPRRKPSPPVPGQSARGPAFKEECVWVGKRIVSLLARDDAMAAGDFIPFYRQFNCPEEHLALAFGCVVTSTDPSENEALADRIDQCWDDPETESPPRAPTERNGKNAGPAGKSKSKAEPNGEGAVPDGT
jgi:hypothetical protein